MVKDNTINQLLIGLPVIGVVFVTFVTFVTSVTLVAVEHVWLIQFVQCFLQY